MKEERLLPVGTRVFDVRYGWGQVDDSQKDVSYPLRIEFDNQEYEHYTLEGMYLDYDKKPLLSLTEYTLENGGFTPISEYWTKPKIGDWGYFWDIKYEGIHFSQLKQIQEGRKPYLSASGTTWMNFSEEIPQHIKKQMQQ